MRDGRAILFDLDDTLYPLDRFVLSGFQAVAAVCEARWNVPRQAALDVLTSAFVRVRGRELQVLAEHFRLELGAVPVLVDVIRTHVPDLHAPELAVSVLRTLAAGWKVGIVTNGRPDIQRRKMLALGLARAVDTVVYANEHGSGVGKPEAAPFLAACRALGVAPAATVFVGDDPVTDIAGAHAVGMKTIWLPSRLDAAPPAAAIADVLVASLADVPAAAARLILPDWRAHVA